MLVTCPECNEKISDEADPCPKCGLSKAGKRSKEYNERLADSNKEFWGKEECPHSLRCLKCGYVGIRWGKIKPELIKEDVGYSYACGDVYCPKCKCKDSDQRTSEVSPVNNQEPRILSGGDLVGLNKII